MRHHREVEVTQIQGANPQQRHVIRDPSMVGEARRAAQQLAQEAQLDETSAGRVGIVVTELAGNLVRHAGGGEILLQALQATDGSPQIEVLALDSGPGMDNVQQCLTDGFSTGGTPGTGLGAVRRLSALFDVFSSARGSVVVARIGTGPCASFGAVCIPVRGETACGDNWRLASGPDGTSMLVIDGLGHGAIAAEAAHGGAAAFGDAPFDAADSVMERVHGRLHGTRGAAGACLQKSREGRIRFCGVGNISARAFGAGASQGLTSHNGILGLQTRRVQQFEYEGRQLPLLVLHSDGVSARWELDQYEGLRHCHPAVVAGVIYREHRRDRDDATILVARHD